MYRRRSAGDEGSARKAKQGTSKRREMCKGEQVQGRRYVYELCLPFSV